jgi:hypothetical protein
MTTTRYLRPAAVLAFAAIAMAACAGDDAGSASSPTPAPSTTSAGETGPVPAADLAAAQDVVLRFVDSLGRGDLDAAAAVVGPVSEQQANGAGGLRSLLQQSTEGHGAWLRASGRTVTAIGVEPGIVAVVLEGTLNIEGTSEHRIAVFPARKAESAAAWFVDPWSYDLGSGPPLRITNPRVDSEEQASVSGPLEVQVETNAAGTVFATFDAQPPTRVEVTGTTSTTLQPQDGSAHVAIMLYEAGRTLYGTGFRLNASDASSTTSRPTTG